MLKDRSTFPLFKALQYGVYQQKLSTSFIRYMSQRRIKHFLYQKFNSKGIILSKRREKKKSRIKKKDKAIPMESLHASYNYRKVKLRRTISTMYKLKLKMKNLNKKSLNFENINGYFFLNIKLCFFFFYLFIYGTILFVKWKSTRN